MPKTLKYTIYKLKTIPMKNKMKTAALAACLLWGLNGVSQQISLHTGRINPANTALQPLWPNASQPGIPETDDTWWVKLPGSPFYQNAYITSGIMSPGGGQYVGKDNTVRWIAPARNNAGEHLDNQPVGQYHYRMHFILNECQFAGCKNSANPPVIVLNHIGGDNVIDQISVNSANYPVNFPYSPFTSNATIPLAVNDLQIGVNTIIVRVNNLHNWTGMEINGYLELNSMPDFTLTDKNGNPASIFCLLDDVILDPGITRTTSYNIKVFQGTQLVTSASGSGDIGPYNVSDLMRPVIPQITPGTVYTVEYEIFTSCGTFKRTKTFEYECCNETNDPSFTVMLDQFGLLTATGAGFGIHSWEVFSTPSVHTGPYTSVHQETNPYPTFEFQGIEGKCYHIKHWLFSPCGEFCDAQTVCMSTCNLEECILPQPSAWYNSSNGTINWSPIAGAIKYIVVITTNDPACCFTDGTSTSAMASTTQQYVVYGTSYPAGQPATPEGHLLRCYSYRVYAICPDGTPSPSSQVICFNFPHDGRPSGITSVVDEALTVSQFEIFPNPASGRVTLACNRPGTMIADVSIMNATGLTLKVLENKPLSSAEPLVIDIHDLKPGMYLLSVKSNGSQVKYKLVVE